MTENINARLAALPTTLGYDSPAALAKASGIDPNTLRKAMQGPSKPGFDVLHGVLAKHRTLSPAWLMLGSGNPLSVEDPAANAPLTPLPAATVALLTQQLHEARTEIKELQTELKQARKEGREDLIAQARLYNSVKESQEATITRLYAKVDEYELRLGLRQPTAAERQQQEQAGSGAPRMEIIPFGERYRTLDAEEPQAAAKPAGKLIPLYPEAELSQRKVA